ncbi:MAG: SpoIIE family protein phosphatase [Oscillospiraceae bacterium]|nr:SpoIIE family protein phosphatase [Oscillospiraceae bacterium]
MMYTKTKRIICDIVRDDGHRSIANRIFSNVITALIIVNVTTVVLDLLEVIPARSEPVFYVIEAVSVAIFTVEYILRLWTVDILFPRIKPAKARLRYALSPMSLVDIMAILPFYLPMAFPINMTILRLLRLLRLLRVLKLNRYSNAKTSEMILSSIKEAIVLTDADGSFLSANNAAEKLFPSLKSLKKYAPINQSRDWPEELRNIDGQTAKDSISFEMNNSSSYHKADISFIYDREKLLRYIIIIQDVTETVLLERAERERLQSELMISAKIQSSMLPNVFPPFPNRTEFDIFALMDPAKEVGGDFYDFFFISENKLAVVMADVSGKGIPAALFMVKAKTLLENTAQRGKPLSEVMEIVNNQLCEGNDECMFVTVFLGVLDITSGKFSYVNGGHDVPLLKQGDRFDWLPVKPALMPGFMPGTKYEQDEITLQKGDVLFLYTDGVTEAENPGKEQFTDKRLIDVANECDLISARELLNFTRIKVDEFVDGEEQFDDITMLALLIE